MSGTSSHVFHRLPKESMPTAISGDGCYIVDSAGKRYLDASGGAAVSCLGHSHPAVREAMHAQIDKLAFAYSGFFTTEPLEELADYLIDKAPEGLERVFFVSGGSEALEAAIKIARQYFVEIGQNQRTQLIARRQSYHGNTLGALSLGGNMARRVLYQPLLSENAHHIAPCYAYREQRHDETEEEYGQRAANELEAKIIELGPDTVAAFACEPVVGATSGVVPAVPGYLRRIREICDKYGVLLIFDEVMTSRLAPGGLHGELGITPDLVTLGKYLGGGLTFGAFGGRTEIMDRFDPRRPGAWPHAGTFNNNVLTMAAGLAGLTQIYTPETAIALNRRGDALRARLNGIAEAMGLPIRATGRGSMMCLHAASGPVRRPADVAGMPKALRDLLHLDLLEKGQYIARRGMINLSLPMDTPDTDRLAAAFAEVLESRVGLIEQAV
jgi:adenosylmethionine-8-amino-7-oxononanoate aminotransferase